MKAHGVRREEWQASGCVGVRNLSNKQFATLESIVQATSEHATLLQAFEPGTARAQERPQSSSRG
eukprot:1007218-Alexandrium_andersonii.AAC.1